MSNNQPLNNNQVQNLDLDLDLQAINDFENKSNYQDEADDRLSNKPISNSADRRSTTRVNQRKGIRNFFRNEINYLVAVVERSWRGWFALITSIVLSTALLVWSLTIRRDVIKEHDIFLAQKQQKQLVLGDLLKRWSQGELKTLKERVHSAESRVFPTYKKLASWLNTKAEIADNLHLTMQYSLSRTHLTEIKHVGEIPISITVSAKAESGQHNYLRMLEFVHGLVDDQWHLEITNTSMDSTGYGVNNMNVTVLVWIHDESIETPQQ